MLDINGIQIASQPLANLPERPVLVTLRSEEVILSSEQCVRNPKWAGCVCNILTGTIVEITLMKSIAQVTVDVGFTIKSKLTLSSLSDLGLSEGNSVCVQFKVNALNVSLQNTLR